MALRPMAIGLHPGERPVASFIGHHLEGKRHLQLAWSRHNEGQREALAADGCLASALACPRETTPRALTAGGIRAGVSPLDSSTRRE